MHTSTRVAAAAIAALTALLLLGACATGRTPAASPTDPTPTPTPTPTAEETPEPTPEPTDVAEGPVVNGPNSIDAPRPGDVVVGPDVLVTGEGTAFEATLNYRVVVTGTEDVVDEGWTMAGANGEIGPYEIELTLEPGEYTVQVWEPDVSDGEGPDGPYRYLVEVSFTVT